jgi:simple sugar transport system substrate-binding protein
MLVLIALVALLAIVAAGCGKSKSGSSSSDTAGATSASSAATSDTSGSSASTSAPAAGKTLKIAVVTHGQAADPFWSVVKNGIDAAAKDMGVQVTYQAPQTFDMNAMKQLIQQAANTKPDGMIVSIPDATALGPQIKATIAAGIPVISINSGDDAYKALGVIAHVGQPELVAGTGAGERMGQEGVKNAICVNQEVGNASLDARCKGFADGLAKSGGKSKVLSVDLNNPTDAAQKIKQAAQGGVDGVLTLGPTGAAPALKALDTSKVKLATFDLSPDVLQALLDGKIQFAIDQQQWYQGYLGVVFMTKYLQYGVIPGGGAPVLTGPSFVTKDNAQQVIDLSKQGIR